ncbi:hypothetical protein [Clostridium sartagoforme]|nr:hypothetical protein [Clostridium sartagoforme]
MKNKNYNNPSSSNYNEKSKIKLMKNSNMEKMNHLLVQHINKV